MVKTKTAQYMHDIELNFTEKEKRTQTRKLKRFLSKSKGCSDEEIYHNGPTMFLVGPQCKPTRNKHGMVTRLTC